MSHTPSVRSVATSLRTYSRPTSSGLENWSEVIERSTRQHHFRLWEEAGGSPDLEELHELTQLGLERKALVAGRTLWLGGTEYAYERAACQFNCCYTDVSTVYDVVDAAWLLYNGCGVGFSPHVGTLRGFPTPITDISVVPSNNAFDFRGNPDNRETLDGNVWKIVVGDSSHAWSKVYGKLLNPPPSVRLVRKLILDFSEVRGPGGRLRGYGWLCNGYRPLADALVQVCHILNSKAGELLDEIDIMDLVNLIGTTLSSRRAAEACELDFTSPKSLEFLNAKRNFYKDRPWRRQSNNSFLFWSKPSKSTLLDILYTADECGGDPAIVNAEGMRRKCVWGRGFNPCFEIALSSKGFCNLTSVAPALFNKNFAALERAVYLIARANYRQCCVNLEDGVLQASWNQTNESLRLCGVSITSIVQSESWLSDYQIRRLRNVAVVGAYSMADELGLPRPKAITTVTPSGTRAKISGCEEFGEISEGIHKPMGRYLFNFINFSIHDPLVPLFESAHYKTLPNPSDPSNVLVCFPVEYRGMKFDCVDNRYVNLESAEIQLNRYLRWNNLWADHNCSSTISYDVSEIPDIANWISTNWDRGYIATSFLRRINPLLTPKDVGHPYLPQEVVTQERYEQYTQSLGSVDWKRLRDNTQQFDLEGLEECKGGVCPSK